MGRGGVGAVVIGTAVRVVGSTVGRGREGELSCGAAVVRVERWINRRGRESRMVAKVDRSTSC